jgi:hypothetical protein
MSPSGHEVPRLFGCATRIPQESCELWTITSVERNFAATGVCTESLNPSVMVMTEPRCMPTIPPDRIFGKDKRRSDSAPAPDEL